MNIRELYDKGHRRFRFSNGDIKEPCAVTYDDGQSLGFSVGYAGKHIWYLNNGRPNIGGSLPTIVGVEGDDMSEQDERTKRDEIQQAIERGVSNAAAAPIGVDDYNEIVTRVLHELDTLVERWTDEETAEDLDKSIRESDVYVGMRVRMVDPLDEQGDPPAGATGAIIVPDVDGAPGVEWDDKWEGYNGSSGRCGTRSYEYVSLSRVERE